MGRFLGIEGFFSRIAEKGHVFSATVSVLSDAIKLQAALQEMEQRDPGGENEALAAKVMSVGLSTIFKLGKLEVRVLHSGLFSDIDFGLHCLLLGCSITATYHNACGAD